MNPPPPSSDAIVDSSILRELDARGVTEARHFTTSRGLVGILATRALLCHNRLREEDIVSLIQIDNCMRRWDHDWFNYVNLSVQRINGYLYGISSGKWHIGDDLWWAVLGFDREVLAHEGVYFTTTNNAYSTVKRNAGIAGLEAIYADEVITYKGGPQVLRRNAHSPNQPTCPQAEALYPESLSTKYLRTIYVPTPELADTVYGWIKATGHPEIIVRADPEAFA